MESGNGQTTALIPDRRPVTNASQVNVAQFGAEARHFADMTHGLRARLISGHCCSGGATCPR
jgi:hypothetical protein